MVVQSKNNGDMFLLGSLISEFTIPVLRLMSKPQPFEEAPRFIRARLYHYRYTPFSENVNWWTRELQYEYMPVFSRNDEILLDYLKRTGLLLTKEYYSPGRWYFGGLASAGAACCTHPLDLLKVHLQTQQVGKISLTQMAVKLYRTDGILSFYNGLSASLLRQLTYSTTRFGMYETLKKQFPSDHPLPFYQKAFLAGISGACGGFVGTPGDLVNVRMQNDVKLPPAERRNYKHAIDGVFRILREEGIKRLFGGQLCIIWNLVLHIVV
ncbi:dicarboxylate transporter domain protein, partial [Ostertagia ostertagi]